MSLKWAVYYSMHANVLTIGRKWLCPSLQVWDKWRKAVILRAHVKVPFKSKCYSSRDSLIRTPLRENTQVICSSNVYRLNVPTTSNIAYFYVKIKKNILPLRINRMNKYKINEILVYSLTEFQDSRKYSRSNRAVKYYVQMRCKNSSVCLKNRRRNSATTSELLVVSLESSSILILNSRVSMKHVERCPSEDT